jgi:hypothetical protein
MHWNALLYQRRHQGRNGVPHRRMITPLIYPNPKYVAEFLGTVNLSRFEEPKRICESIAPPPKQLDEQGSKIAELAGPLIKSEDWILAIIASLWDEDILEPALETAKLLKNDQGYVDWFTQP